ncbi:MAG TPA: HAMP domain-containing protein [Clostridia bacterium]|nr:HAMP domain-containing protein [Clostridia bacterium]
MNGSGSKARPFDALRNLPLQVKITLIAVGMTLILGLVLVWQIRHYYYQLETAEVQTQAGFTARVFAAGVAPLVRNGDLAGAQKLLDDMSRTVPGVRAARLLDADGEPLTEPAPHPALQVDTLEFIGKARLPSDLSGSVSVALDDSHVDFELSWHTRRLVITTAIIGILGAGISLWLMRLVTQPIQDLVRIARAAKTGNYEVRAALRAKDEVGELASAFNDMMATLREKEAINRQLLRKTMAAAEEERRHISRELHDQTGQALTSLIAGLAALKADNRTGRVTELLGLATQTLTEVNALSRTLRPSALDDLGLVPALQRLCENTARRHEMEVDFSTIGLEDDERLSPSIEVALYRIAQEALTNVVRHSGARAVEVMLHRKSTGILLVVEDDGRGFTAGDWRAQCLRDDHLGLLGIEERAVLLSGTLRLESRPGAGASLFVDIPLEEKPLCQKSVF